MARLVKDSIEESGDISQNLDLPLNFTELSTQTEGYSATDLKDLVARAIHQVAMRASSGTKVIVGSFYLTVCATLIIFLKQLELTQADFAAAQVDFVPLSLRDVKLEKSDTAWSDIGGTFSYTPSRGRWLNYTRSL